MELYHRRIYWMIGICAALFLVLGFSLFTHAVVNGEEYYQEGQISKTRTVTLQANRGKIQDVNGLTLAYDRESYNIEFYRNPFRTGERWRAVYTDILVETISIIEYYGGETIDTFMVRRYAQEDITEEMKEEGIKAGDYYFAWGVTSESAVEARKKLWTSNFYLSEEISAYDAYITLRERYCIPEHYTFEQARQILSIWQEVQNMAFKSYIPVVIAYDVDAGAVAEIEERAEELEGMSAAQSTVRVYPNDSVAAHVIGYLGKESNQTKLQEMLAAGYSGDDKVGVTGVEATMERYLSAAIGSRKGKRVIEVDSIGREINELEYLEPSAGYDVTLTLDIELQKVAEQALKENIEEIRAGQILRYNTRYSYYKALEDARGGTATKFAETGAVVVIDANNGNILALASYPGYDLNLFTNGISIEDYAKLNDPTTTPLFNKAISSRAEPGSIFKMATGYAGLVEGYTTVDETIDCLGEFREGIQADSAGVRCWAHETYWQHADENIVGALKDSCNYYFFMIAYRMGIDKLNHWADIFGLTSQTGIELTGEVTSYVANPSVLYDNTEDINTGQKTYKPYLVKQQIKKKLQVYGVTLGVEYREEQLEKAADRIIALVEPNAEEQEYGADIRVIMREELGIDENVSYSRRWYSEIASMMYEIKWNSTQTILTGIGQSVTAVTPVALARYVAAIANGGTVYNVSIIDKVTDTQGNIVYESTPSVFSTLNDTNGYLEYIKEGMKEVVSLEDGGSAAKIFEDFEYKDDIAGKTGTAQVSTIDIEDTAWFVAFTPYENAEIAIVVYIPNGQVGANAGETAKDIIQFYRDRQKIENEGGLAGSGEILE